MKSLVEKSIAILVLIMVIVSFMSLSTVSANSWLPNRKQYSGGWDAIGSTSKRILEIMISQSNYATFVNKTDCNYYNLKDTRSEHVNELVVVQDSVNGMYSVRIPEDYFIIYHPWKSLLSYYPPVIAFDLITGGYDYNNEYRNYPLERSNKYDAYDRVDTFDFSNENLGDISVLPDFTKWCFFVVHNGGNYMSDLHMVDLKFSNCGITDLSTFKNNISKLKGNRIYLDGNTVTKADYDEFERLAKNNDVCIVTEPTIITPTTNTNTSNNSGKTTNTNTSNNSGKTNNTTTPTLQLANTTTSNTKSSGKVTKNQVYAVMDKLGVKHADFDKYITLAKKGQTGSMNTLMLKNNAAFAARLTQSDADLLCKYIKEQTGLTYNVTIPAKQTGTSNTKNTSNTQNTSNTKNTSNAQTILTTTTTTTYSWSSNFNSDAEVSSPNVPTKSKIITVHVYVSGDKAPYTPAEPTDFEIYVDGQMVENKNGIGKKSVTSNGIHTIRVVPTYDRDKAIEYTVTVKNIDRTAPTIKSIKIYKNGSLVNTNSATYFKAGDKVKFEVTASEKISKIRSRCIWRQSCDGSSNR